MNPWRVDLHVHTCLSPCGSLDMSPAVIVRTAIDRGLQAIAITDHNTTIQCPVIQALGEENGLTVFAGVEVTSREEAHCLVFFPTDDARQLFQAYIDRYLPRIPNNPERFGDQVWVDRHENILGECPWLLISAIDQSINQISHYAHSLGCLFVPAHVERPVFSIISQLGFMDPSLRPDAVEYNNQALFDKLLPQHPYLQSYTHYTASDAHVPEQIGTKPWVFPMSGGTLDALREAFSG